MTKYEKYAPKDGEGVEVEAPGAYKFRLPRVFTIFCHGTGGHRNGRDLELITEFGAAYWGRGDKNEGPDLEDEFYKQTYQKSFLILDGVGTCDMYTTATGPAQVGNATDTAPGHPTPGDFEPCDALKAKKRESGGEDWQVRVTGLKLKKLAWSKHRGDIHGDGWDDNVAHALFVLKQLKDSGEFPEVINCTGWSRGGVTCLKLAYWIHEYFVEGKAFHVLKNYEKGYVDGNYVELSGLPKITEKVKADDLEINLFPIDPVPGRFSTDSTAWGSSKDEEKFPPGEVDYQNLPPTVKRCIITLACDEQREGFVPICGGWPEHKDENGKVILAAKEKLKVKDSTKSTVVWLPFPGIHRGQLRMEPRDPLTDGETRVFGKTIKKNFNEPPVRHLLTAVPHLVWDLAWRFLTQCGTHFKRNILEDEKFGGGLLGVKDVVELYSNVWLLKEAYHQGRNRGLKARAQGGLAPRLFTGYPFGGRDSKFSHKKAPTSPAHLRRHLFTKRLGYYVKYPGFFINEHHRCCFEIAYPELYKWLTTGKRETEQEESVFRQLSEPKELLAELESIDWDLDLGHVLSQLAIEKSTSEEGVVSFAYKPTVTRRGDELGEPLWRELAWSESDLASWAKDNPLVDKMKLSFPEHPECEYFDEEEEKDEDEKEEEEKDEDEVGEEQESSQND
jgi:Domain of unknown function (DUF5621)